MLVIKKEELENGWEITTHDKEDNVKRSNVFYWPDLGFDNEKRGKLAFMHLASLKPAPDGWFSKHHHGEKQDPGEGDPQIGMLEVFVHKSGKAAMFVEDEEVSFDEKTPIIVIQPGEVHSMINRQEEEFRYWVFGFSTGGGTFNVE